MENTQEEDIAAIKVDVASIKGTTQTTGTKVANIESAVDGVEGKLDTLNTTVETIKTNTDEVEGKLNTIITNTHNIDENTDEVEEELANIYAQEQQIYGAIPDIRRAVTELRVRKFYVGDNPTSHSEELHFKETEGAVEELLEDGYRPYMFLGVKGDWSYWLFAKYTAQNTHIPAN